MSESYSSSSSGGIGFCGLLTVLFIGLKLTHYIDWSWWWALSPLWIGLAVILGILGIALVGIIIAAITSTLLDRRSAARIRARHIGR